MSFTIVPAPRPEFPLEQLAGAAVALLKRSKSRVALAESCTGGLIAKSVTDVSGASEVFDCGIVSYSESIKMKLLGVKPETLEKYSVFSAETAAEMAEGVRRLAGAELGIGVTGVAGPGPDGEHPEGEIYVSLSSEKETFVCCLQTGTHNERTWNREYAASIAFSMIIEYFSRY